MSEQQRQLAEPGGEWILRDLKGGTFSSINMRGNYYLLFFGHTLCPDATPLTLHKITKAVKRINSDKES